MQQEYNVGKYLREHYVDGLGFLSGEYSAAEVHVRSTDMDRTLQSAECELAGLFPPDPDAPVFSPPLDWQPIPVHMVPLDQDSLLAPWDCLC